MKNDELIRKPPREWAIAKGLLRVRPNGVTDYRKRPPWEFEATNRYKRWPDPMVDPTFTLTESEFTSAVRETLALTEPATNQPAKG